MTGPLQQLQAVQAAVAGQVTHVAGLHHAIAGTGDPQTRHPEGRREPGQLPHGAAVGAAGQQAPGGPRLRQQGTPPGGDHRQWRQPGGPQRQKGRATLAQAGEGPGLVHPPSRRHLHQPPQLAPQMGSGMEGHAAAEGVTQQHHRPFTDLGAQLIGQPAAIARQAGLQPLRPRPPSETRQIGTPAGKNGLKLAAQGIPQTTGEEPAMQSHEQGNGRIPAFSGQAGRPCLGPGGGGARAG